MGGIDNTLLDEFFDTLQERHRIWGVRQNPEAELPYTEDPIFQQYRFCNLFRELDTVTIWIRENIRERWADHPHLWFALCAARQINWPTTLETLDGLLVDWDSEAAQDRMFDMKEAGERVYTGAYMITNGGVSCPKIEYTCDYVLSPLWDARSEITEFMEMQAQGYDTQSLRKTFDKIQGGFLGFGKFMTYEAVTDMRWTRYLEDADDVYTWANAGPGAIRGLNRLHGRQLKHNPNSEKTLGEMHNLLVDSTMYLPESFPDLEMRDIEHWLCEFDKYQRVKNGEGRPRSKFAGTTPKQKKLI